MLGFKTRKEPTTAGDLGLLALRLTAGGLMTGHGAQKLFGAFGGFGVEGTAGWLGSMGLKPPKLWAYMAGGSELGSGVSLLTGFFTPVGAVSVFGPMIMAWNKAHAGKPIWITTGGAELILMYMGAAATLALTGPGRFSLDEAWGIEVPTWVTGLTVAGVAAGVVVGIMAQPEAPQEVVDAAAAEVQSQGQSDEIATELGA